MKRSVSLAIIFMVAALCFFTAALAQEEPAAVKSPTTDTDQGKKEPATPVPDKPGVVRKQVMVLKGGNLALIAEKCGHSQTDWRSLYEANPNLPKPTKAGLMWGVLVYPEQILTLPQGWSYSTLDPEYLAPLSTRQEELGQEETGPPIPPQEETSSAEDVAREGAGSGNAGYLLDPLFWAMILLLLGSLVTSIAPWWFRRRDPRRYPAVIPGGLREDLNLAAEQLYHIYRRRYKLIQRGQLVRYCGHSRILIKRMSFGDGVSRPVYLKPGDEVYRGALPNGEFNYFLRSCGNLGPEFELPVGWVFSVIDSYRIQSPAASATEQGSVSHPEPTPEPAPELASVPVPEPAQELKPEAIPPVPPAPPVPPISPVSPIPPVTPAPILPDEPEPIPEIVDVLVESRLLKLREESPTAEEISVTETKDAKSPRKVKVIVGDFFIEVVGNGEIPNTKIETDDGATVIVCQKK